MKHFFEVSSKQVKQRGLGSINAQAFEELLAVLIHGTYF